MVILIMAIRHIRTNMRQQIFRKVLCALFATLILFAGSAGCTSNTPSPTTLPADSPGKGFVQAVMGGGIHLFGLTGDGRIFEDYQNPAEGENPKRFVFSSDITQWKDVVSLAAGPQIIAGLQSDGKVLFDSRSETSLGGSTQPIVDVSDWTDIVSVSCGWYHVVGLKSDGTVVAKGTKKAGSAIEVSSWTDIIAVSAGPEHTVGLRKDGTVVTTSRVYWGNVQYSQEELPEYWTDIVAVAAGYDTTLGLRKDGTVLAAGRNSQGQLFVRDWTDIIAIKADQYATVGLKKDGTVVVAGFSFQMNNEPAKSATAEIAAWTGIVGITTGQLTIAAVKSDGTVVAASCRSNLPSMEIFLAEIAKWNREVIPNR